MRSGNKPDLAKCIIPEEVNYHASDIDAAVIEGSVIVNMTKPKKNQTIKNYSAESFYTQIKKHQCNYKCQKIDVVFDTYKCPSLKATTRAKRGKGARRKVQHYYIAPSNWTGFLYLN